MFLKNLHIHGQINNPSNIEIRDSIIKNIFPTGKYNRTENNNGISAFVEEELDVDKNPAHTLTVAVGGSVLSTFYQPLPFYTGFHVLVLEPKKEISVVEMLFYAKCISSNKYKYNYGRQANKTLKEILIPKNMNENEVFVFSKFQLLPSKRFIAPKYPPANTLLAEVPQMLLKYCELPS